MVHYIHLADYSFIAPLNRQPLSVLHELYFPDKQVNTWENSGSPPKTTLPPKGISGNTSVFPTLVESWVLLMGGDISPGEPPVARIILHTTS